MESRITVKLGNLSVEYEGPTEYLRNDLLGLIEQLQGLSARIPNLPELIMGTSCSATPISPQPKP